MSTRSTSQEHSLSETSGLNRWRLASGRVLSIGVALLFVAAYGPRLARSLWVDEAGTFWMAHEGLMPAIRKTLHWPGQSVLYSAIASLFCLDGTPFRDELLRVPSLAGIAIGAYFLFRIAESRVGRGSGFVAVTLFLFHPGVYTVAFQARPYALAMAAVIASCWALCEWETSRSRRHLLYYVIALVLVIYLHYFFSVIAVVHALYLGFVFLVEKRRRRWSDPLWAGIAVLLLAIPLAPHLRLLVSERHTLSYVRPPSLLNLTDSLAPSLLWAGLLTAGILLASFFPLLQRDAGRLDRSFGVLLTSWWLAGPLLFFAVSRVTPMRIFVPRYLASALAAQALLLAVVGCRLFGAGGARVWAVVGVALFAANPLLFERAPDGKEVLLPVIRIVRGQAQAPVFFPSLLQESLFYDWRAGIRPDSYLFAPLVAYPIPNEFFPIPVAPTDDAKAYVDSLVNSRLNSVPEVLFVDKDELWESWIVDRLGRAGMIPEVQTEGSFKVFVFRRTGGRDLTGKRHPSGAGTPDSLQSP